MSAEGPSIAGSEMKAVMSIPQAHGERGECAFLLVRSLPPTSSPPQGQRRALTIREISEYGRGLPLPFPGAMLERQRLVAW